LEKIEDFGIIEEGFNQKRFKMSLLMQGSRDGFSAENFHKLCDGKANTLFLISTEHKSTFGAFTKIPWFSPAKP
jgi:TLD